MKVHPTARILLSLVAASVMGSSIVGCRGSETAPSSPEPSSERTLASGKVVGFRAENGALAWFGIPYAAAPVDVLRWRAPRPPAAWPGVLEATKTGAPCLQRGSWLGGAPDESIGKLFGSEDCLFLNLWAPAEVPEGGLPVMVWIHGGGNRTGHGGLYDFSQMAERFGLVMIAFNYRLGGLGWFYQPSLWSEDDDSLDRSGNFGLLDQVQVLRWVQQNIRLFGGDPQKVTLFGESAGGQNTLALMISPVSEGLFAGAIAQSGYTSSTSPERASGASAGASGEMLLYWLQQEGLAKTRESALDLRRSMSPAEIAAFLRSRTPTQVVMDYYAESPNHSAPIMIRDGAVIPAAGIATAYQEGRIHGVPLVAGTNRDENNLWLSFSSQLVDNYFGVAYRPKDETRYRFFSEYRAKGWKVRGADDPSRWVSAAGGNAYAYRWDWDEEPSNFWGDFSLLVGAAHGLETTFLTGVFPTDGRVGLLFTESNAKGRLQLSRSMQSYWAQFAYSGKPGRGRDNDLPEWPAWNLEKGQSKFMVLDTQAGGGLRMSNAELFRDEVLLAAASDERARNQEDICWLVYLNLKDDPFYTPDLYSDWEDGKCRKFTPAHFDAKAD